MNCLEFRRKLLEDPYNKDAEIFEHEDTCSECAPFAREMRAQEVRLRAMFNAITPPPELAENIQLEVHFQGRASSRRRVWYAAAASILLVMGATVTSLVSETWERGNMALAQSVLNHIDDEAQHLHTAGPTAPTRIAHVFERFGAKITGDLGQVNFAAECLMRKSNGVHLVLPGKQGPITIFYMPNEIASRFSKIDSDRFHGEIVPTVWGSVAAIGEQGENLDGIAQHMADNVIWPTKVALSSTELAAASHSSHNHSNILLTSR